jgi:hypothetical protein
MSLLLLMGGAAPSIGSLFANNEAGLALDAEAAYLRGWTYQDSAGATVAASAGDPVGLILDTSKGGLDQLGSDLVSNGTFASDTVWSKGANWNISSGVATKTGGAANNLTQTISSTAGLWYRITMDVTRTAGTLTVSLGTSGTTYAMSASGSYTFYILAGSSTQTLTLAGDSSFAGTVDNVTARLVPGNHAYQTTSGSRPTLSIATASTGRTIYGLTFDGVDDSLATASVDFSATDKMTVMAGVRKLSDAVTIICELTANANTNNGAFTLYTNTAGLGWASKGTTIVDLNNSSGASSPIGLVLTGQGNINTPASSLRQNGVGILSSTSSQGSGNYSNAILYIGSRGGSSFRFNGILYTLIIRGATTPTATIADFEKNLLARRCGVTF